MVRIIKNLKDKKSPEHDNITPKLMETCVMPLSGPLTHIGNLSFASGHFPSQLKIAKVIPIFNNNDLTQPGNYRPISLLSIINKLMFYRIYKFLTKHNILYP